MADGWCTIESDPGVFTELLATFGVKGVQLEELYSLDDESLGALQPIYGLIFLFKWQKPEADAEPPTISEDPTIFFANQVVNNACATQAMIQILLNKDTDVEIGAELQQLKDFTGQMSTDMRGLAISNSEPIRTAHNSFSHQGFVSIEDPNQKEGDAFHFIGYIEKNGRLIELDGLQQGPIDHGPTTNWLATARTVIEARIQQYSDKEIRFNLMAMVRDRKLVIQDEITAIEEQLPAATDSVALEMREQIEQLRDRIAGEDAKRETWKRENKLRRFNFIPLCVQLLKALAEQGKMGEVVEAAKEKKKASQQGSQASK